MRRPLFAIIAGVLIALAACDPIRYARVRAPLLAPLDSVCLKHALEVRLGPPVMPQHFQKRSAVEPAALWVYHKHASYTQLYWDVGVATLVAAQPVASGIEVLWYSKARRDSVRSQLGRDILAVRDHCGGRQAPDSAELILGR